MYSWFKVYIYIIIIIRKVIYNSKDNNNNDNNNNDNNKNDRSPVLRGVLLRFKECFFLITTLNSRFCVMILT